MKHLVLTLVLIATVTLECFSQEEPIPPRRSRTMKVGGLAGFTPGWLFVDVKPINEFLVPSRGAALKDDGVFLYGGGGAAYIMFIPNLRIGGQGMSGAIESSSLDASGIRRDVRLNVGFGGVTFEYVVPVVERLDIALGVLLGGGGIDITLRQNNGGNSTWQQQWDFFKGTGTVNNNTRKLEGSYFVWVPSLSIEYAVLGWLAVRVGGSYVGMSGPSWTVDDKFDVLGVPSNVNGKGFLINAGLFVGTF